MKKFYNYKVILVFIILIQCLFSVKLSKGQWVHYNLVENSNAFPNNVDLHIVSVIFTDACTGYLTAWYDPKDNTTTDNSIIYKSIDGGKTWVQKFISYDHIVGSIYFYNNVGYAVGENALGLKGVILKSTDAGESWIEEPDPYTVLSAYSVFLSNQSNGICIGMDQTLKLTSGKWSHVSDAIGRQITGIENDYLHAWICKTGSYQGVGFSRDGGKTWTYPTLPIDGIFDDNYVPFNGIDFIDINKGYAVGGSGRLIRTLDGGNHWTPIHLENNQYKELQSVSMVESLGFAVAGESFNGEYKKGSIWRSTSLFDDSKSDWTRETDVPSNTSALFSVFTLDENHAWAVGYNGTILKYYRALEASIQPGKNVTKCEGDEVVFTAGANRPTCELGFQWYKDGNIIEGANHLSLIIPNVQLSDAGTYTCYITDLTDKCADVVSVSSVLRVCSKPVIWLTSLPIVNVCANEPISLICGVISSCPVKSHWQENNININDDNIYSGTSTSTLNISNVNGLIGNQYTFIVDNGVCPFVKSNSITLACTVEITGPTNPSNGFVCNNSSTTISVQNKSLCPMVYQWQADGVNITDAGVYSGTQTKDLHISNVNGLSGKKYRCIVSNGTLCNTTSSSMTLTVCSQSLNLTRPIPNIKVCEGDLASLKVEVFQGSSCNITYQWQVYNNFTWTDITDNSLPNHTYYGAQGKTLFIYTSSRNVSLINNNQYRCKVSTVCEEVITNSSTLTICKKLEITGPNDTHVCEGDAANLSINIINESYNCPVTYQWRSNGIPISNGALYSGTQSSTLTINKVSPELQDNNYDCILTGLCSIVYSSSAKLLVSGTYKKYYITGKVQPYPGFPDYSLVYIYLNTYNKSISCPQFELQESDDKQNWHVINNQLGITTFSILKNACKHYRFRIYCPNDNDPCHQEYYTNIFSTCNKVGTISITTEPESQEICNGGDAMLNISAESETSNLAYQWYKIINGEQTLINGATTETFELTSSSKSDDGGYYCVVEDENGSLTSNIALLKVVNTPIINQQPADNNICKGMNYVIDISTNGGDTLNYNWYKDANLLNINKQKVTLYNAKLSDEGTYYCVISNACGNVTSSSATIVIVNNTNVSTAESNIDATAQIDSSAVIGGNNRIGSYTTIGANTNTGDNVNIGSNCLIGSNVTIGNNAFIGNNVTIEDGALIEEGSYIGFDNQEILQTSANTVQTIINLNSSIQLNQNISNTLIGQNVVIGKYSRIGNNDTILNNSRIGSYADIGNSNIIGSNAQLGNFVWMNSNSSINQSVKIGDGSYVGHKIQIGDSTDIGINAILRDSSNISRLISISDKTIIEKNTTINNSNQGITSSPYINEYSCEFALYNANIKGNFLNGFNAISNNATLQLINQLNNMAESTQTMSVSNNIIDNITYTKQGFNVNDTITFAALDSSSTYLWDFGDCTTSTEKNPKHKYTAPGIYIIKLSENNTNTCSFIKNYSGAISVYPSDNAGLIINASKWKINHNVSFRKKHNISNVNPPSCINTNDMCGSYNSIELNTLKFSYNWNFDFEQTILSLPKFKQTLNIANNLQDSTNAEKNEEFTYFEASQQQDSTINFRYDSLVKYKIQLVSITQVPDLLRGGWINTPSMFNCTDSIMNEIPPVILNQPVGDSVCKGNDYTFNISVLKKDTFNISYHWYRNDTLIPSANDSVYAIFNVDSIHEGQYKCIVSNIYGSVTSNTVELKINSSPIITQHPLSGAPCMGSNYSFRTGVKGTPLFEYHWFKNDSLLYTNSDSVFSLQNLSNEDSGEYFCVVTNLCGFSFSNTALLSIQNTLPIIQDSLEDKTQCSNTYFELKGSVNGSNQVDYKWYKNDSLISESKDSILSINNIIQGDAGEYHFVVSNGCGSKTSNTALLTVNNSPQIELNPNSLELCLNRSGIISVISNEPNLQYQWYKNDSLISNAKDSILFINNATINNAGNYKCIVNNASCSITSNDVPVNVYETTQPKIIVQSNDTLCQGNEFELQIQDTDADSYKWLHNGEELELNNGRYEIENGILKIEDISESDEGYYYCVVKHLCGDLVSDTVRLTVNKPITFTKQILNTHQCLGGNYSFEISVKGTPPYIYKWYKNDTLIPGAIDSTLSLSNIVKNDEGNYKCVVANICGSDTSYVAILSTDDTPPSIVTQPTGGTGCSNTNFAFSISATGSTPLNYNWKKNDSIPIRNTQDSIIRLYHISLSDAGNYNCIVSNACGQITSDTVTLIVHQAPLIIQQTRDTALCAGSNLNINIIDSTYNLATTYQWYFNDEQISGNNTQIILDTISTANAGIYKCVLSNENCSLTSENTLLFVSEGAPTIVKQPEYIIGCLGSDIIFTTKASSEGTEPILYEWYKNNEHIYSTYDTLMTLYEVNLTEVGTYYCIVSNACGRMTSDSVTLTVNVPPIITEQPKNLYKHMWQEAKFEINGSGTEPITYQWYKDNYELGITNYEYIINNIDSTNAGGYYCVVSNECGSVTSNIAELNILPRINIICPRDTSICGNQYFEMTGNASGSDSIKYKWIYYGHGLVDLNTGLTNYEIPNGEVVGTGNTIAFSDVKYSNGGYYKFVVEDSIFTDTCYVTLDVMPKPQIICPHDTTVCSGSDITLNVMFSQEEGLVQPRTRWLYNGEIAGNGLELELTDVTEENSGEYKFICYYPGAGACGDTCIVNLTVESAPKVRTQPVSNSVCEGSEASFGMSLKGSVIAEFQWYHDNVQLPINNPDTTGIGGQLTIDSVGLSDAGEYYCEAMNMCGSVRSDTVKLFVSAPLTFICPTDTTVCEGTNLVISGNVEGVTSNTGTTQYRWIFNNEVIGTTSSLSLNNVTVNESGNYILIEGVQNDICGVGIDTCNFTININTIPIIIQQVESVSSCPGSDVNLNFTAEGTEPINYQWWRIVNGDSLIFESATQSTFSIDSIVSADAGEYYCIVSNECGSVASDTASIDIIQCVPQIVVQPHSTGKCEGEDASFTMNVTGVKPMTYQWYKEEAGNWNLMNGNIDSTLIISNVDSTKLGNYMCVVSNTYGAISSIAATLSIGEAWTLISDTNKIKLYNSVGFRIGNKIYIGTGYRPDINQYTNEFWEYDIENKVFTKKSNYRGLGRYGAIGFAINGKGYIGTGYDSLWHLTKDFWEYDPTNDNWTRKADFGGSSRGGAVGFAINNKGYVGTGQDSISVLKDFWEYNPQTDSWIRKADFGGINRYGAIGLSAENRGYITSGIVMASEMFQKDLWEYDPNQDVWTKKSDFGGIQRMNALGFSIKEKLYMFNGFNPYLNYGGFSDVWEYNTLSDSWKQKSDCGIACIGTGLSDDNNGYLYSWSWNDNLWEYSPDADDVAIVSQPSELITNTLKVCQNLDTTLTIEATGKNLTYQWMENAIALADTGVFTGTNTSSLHISNVNSLDNKEYTCIVQGLCSKITSNPIKINVVQPLTITKNISSASLCTGNNLYLHTILTGNYGNYQWYKNDTILPGWSTGEDFGINNIHQNDAGIYKCIITNACGSVTTNNAVISVSGNIAPILVDQTWDGEQCAGTEISLFVSTTKDSIPLTYQWYKNDSIQIANANDSIITFNNLNTGDDGYYYCLINKDNGCILKSNSTNLRVHTLLSITDQPVDTNICAWNSGYLFNIRVNGAYPNYMWYKNDTIQRWGDSLLWTGVDNPYDTLDRNQFKCVVSNLCGSVTSNTVNLKFSTSVPSATDLSGMDLTKCIGGDITFKTKGISYDDIPISYRWFKNDSILIPNANDSILTLQNIVLSDTGNYYCEVYNMCGYNRYGPFRFYINGESIQIVQQPKDTSICAWNWGNYFNIYATGTKPFTYQWIKNDTNNLQVNDSILWTGINYPLDALDQNKFKCIVSNQCGSVTSNNARLYYSLGEPIIIEQPEGETILCTGGDFSINVRAERNGTSLIKYEWYKNDSTIITNAKDSVLTIHNITSSDEGSYKCRISNSCGSVTSNTAQLTVHPTPVLSSQPIGGEQCLGNNTSLKISARCSEAATFNWFKNDTVTVGGNDSIYTMPYISESDTGYYKCIVSTLYCSITSNTAYISIYKTLKANFNVPTVSCIKDTVKFLNIEPWNCQYLTYNWDFGNGVIANEKSPKVVFDTTGTYAIKLLITDPWGYRDSVTKELVINNYCGDIHGVLLSSENCGGAPVPNDTIVLIDANNKICSIVNPSVTNNQGRFTLTLSNTLYNDSLYRIDTKHGYNIEDTVYRTLSEWSEFSELTLRLRKVTQEWAAYYGNIDTNGIATAIDLFENVYVAGISNNVSRYINAQGNYSSYITTIKYNPKGESIWIANYNRDSTIHFMPKSIVTDKNKNIYVGASGRVEISDMIIEAINGLPLNNNISLNGDDKLVVLKYDTAGTFIWDYHYSKLNEYPILESIKMDDENNIYINALLYKIVNLDSNSANTVKCYSAIIKLDSSGVVQWIEEIENEENSVKVVKSSTGLDSLGNIYYSALISDPNEELGHIKIVKFNPEGQQQWMINNVDSIVSRNFDIKTDKTGHVYVSSIKLKGHNSMEPITNLYLELLTLKYDSNGNKLWEKVYVFENQNEVWRTVSINIDKSENIFLSGISFINNSSQSGGLVNANNNFSKYNILKYDNSGELLWYEGQEDNIMNNQVIYNLENNMYTKTDENNNFYLSTTKHRNSIPYKTEYLLIKYTANGTKEWETSFSNSNYKNDQLYGMVISPNNNIYLVGTTGTLDTNNLIFAALTTVKFSQCPDKANLLRKTHYDNSSKKDITEKDTKLKLYPNPNDGKFMVDINIPYDSKVEIEVYNMIGSKVIGETQYLKKGENILNLNINNPMNGIYLIAVKTEKEVFNRKVVIR